MSIHQYLIIFFSYSVGEDRDIGSKSHLSEDQPRNPEISHLFETSKFDEFVSLIEVALVCLKFI